ncbi:MAG: type II toxin-antitoxin system VapB family antitoxin [Parvularculaceae bacterium]
MKPEKQLSIRSTEAADLAEGLSKSTGRSKKELVEEGLALVRLREESAANRGRSKQQRFAARILELGRRIREEVGPDLTSDHGWMYDEHGLPK